MKKLKILLVMRHTWGNKMGIPKVFFDFKLEYELMGHQVDTLSYEDLYPKGQNLYDKVFGPIFPELILKYLKKNASKYDVIDANFECVPYPKEAFNFKGVLLFRSHGLPQVYKMYEEVPPYKKVLDDHKDNIKFKSKIGNIYRRMQRQAGSKELNSSIDHADIVHALNRAEYKFLLEYGVAKERLVMIPNGLEDKYIEEASKASVENKGNNIAFVASWTLRKGITELNEILNSIKSKVEVDELHLLGGDQPKEVVLKQFENENFSKLKITPEFEQTELISLLSNAKVGIFPSYVEGFGLAVVEQLACGIPVVAYRVPGPTEILEGLDESLLIVSGDIESLTNKVVEILKMPSADYNQLALLCKERAKAYSMRKVAGQFVEVYKKA
jgi:glycosyltransferase involved in cell wall biosynthesis